MKKMMKSGKWGERGEKIEKKKFFLKKVGPGFDPESFALVVHNAIP